MSTQVDFPTQVKRSPFIDARSYGVVGDGVNLDGPLIQGALDAAAIASATTPVIVQLPRGRFLCRTVLKFKRDGIILQGYGMMGIGDTLNPAITDNTCSILYADNTGGGHDATPMIRLSPEDCTVGIGNQGWYRGTCLRDISIDVSASTTFTSGTPPSVAVFRALSNCPVFENLCVYGNIGIAYDIGIMSAPQLFCENLTFSNCFSYGGYLPSGATRGVVPTAPAVVITGSDNIRWLGGLHAYFYSGQLPVNNDLTDIPAFKIIPGLIGGSTGVNTINNGFTMDGTIFTNYVVTIRLSCIDFGGQNYCPQGCAFLNVKAENYNKAFQINQETTINTPGFWRSSIVIDNFNFTGAFGTNSHQVQGSKMLGGFITLRYLQITGDLILDSTCTGVHYTIGANPNGVGSFASATDTGANFPDYAKTGLAGHIVGGQTRLMGTTDPASSNASDGDCPLQCYGDTVKLWSAGRAPASSAASGFIGNACISGNNLYWHNGVQWLRLTGSTF